MSNPSVCACYIAFRVTCDPCPSRINICILDRKMPSRIKLMKNDKNSLKRKIILHCHACSWPTIFHVIIFNPLTFKYKEFW